MRVGAKEQGRVRVGARQGGRVRVGARQGAKSQHGHGLVSHTRWLADRLGRLKGKLPRWWKRGPSPPGKDKAAVIRTESGADTRCQPFKSGVPPQT